MKVRYFKPSRKGLTKSDGKLKPDDRIIFIYPFYIWFKADGDGFVWGEKGKKGDVTEWKNKLKKPDSFWQEAGEIDPTTIGNTEYISELSPDVQEGNPARNILIRILGVKPNN